MKSEAELIILLLCTYEIRNANKISINGASFKSGRYLLRVKSDNSICTEKFIKQ